MNLQQLKYIVEIADCRSITRASKNCLFIAIFSSIFRLSPPAMKIFSSVFPNQKQELHTSLLKFITSQHFRSFRRCHRISKKIIISKNIV